MGIKLKLNNICFIWFHSAFFYIYFLKILKIFFEKNYSLKPSLAYLLSYCIFSFLIFLAVWEEIGDKKPCPARTGPIHLFLESSTCGMRVTGYECQDTENELHLRVGLSLRTRQ